MLLFMKAVPAPTLADRARAVRDSDPDAFAALYDELHAPLLRYACTITHDEAAAYDVLQDAFLKLWQVRDRLDPARSVKALLFQIVRNLALKSRRRLKFEQRWPETGLDPGTDDVVAEQVDAEHLRTAVQDWLDAMPERRREVFQLSRFGGMTHQEIATVLEISPKTVNNHLVEALRTLRNVLRVRGFADEML